MATQIFVNLATDDLERARAFYTALGCEINPLFSDENAICAVWGEHVFFMVLTREYFGTFIERPVADAKSAAQVLVALSRDSREAVDATLEAGAAAGGHELNEARDLGLMYSPTIEGPDGNILEFLYMDPAAAEGGPDAVIEPDA